MAFSDLFSRRRKDESDGADAGAADSPVLPTKALGKFLSSLSAHDQPLLVDLGASVGSNITFFGEELGCKILIEDLAKDLDRHIKEEKLDALPGFFAQRFRQEDASVDGILCWDVFDYLDRPSAQALATQLTRILKPEGVLLAFFSTSDPRSTVQPTYTKHVVIDRANLQHRPYPAARPKMRPLLNRDIQRLFEPLRVTEQFLMKTNVREVLFRKPAVPPPAASDAAPAEG